MKKTKNKNVMPDKKPDEEEYLEETDYFTKTELSKPAKVSEQISRILFLRSVDLREGYTTWITDKFGNPHPQIVPDSRKAYIGAVTALKLILAPEIESVEKYKKLVEEYEKGEQRLFKEYGYQERINKVYNENTKSSSWVYGKRFYMPEIGAVLPGDDSHHPNSRRIKPVEGLWDSFVSLYWNSIVQLCDKLFADLNKLVHELNYFEGGGEF